MPRVIHFEIPFDDRERAQAFQEKLEIPGVGYSAIFRDPEGNLIGLFETAGD